MARRIRNAALAGMVSIGVAGVMAPSAHAADLRGAAVASARGSDATNTFSAKLLAKATKSSAVNPSNYAVNIGNGIMEDQNVPDCKIGKMPGESANIYYSSSSATKGADAPLILYVHGGGGYQVPGTIASASHVTYAPFALQQEVSMGATVVTASYPSANVYKFPTQVEYTNCALGFATATFKPTSIGIEGESFGSADAALVMVTQGMRRFDVGPYRNVAVPKISAALLISGYYDIPTLAGTTAAWLMPIDWKKSTEKEGSASTYVSADASKTPVLMETGSKDFIPLSQTANFYNSLVATGHSVTSIVVPGAEHDLANTTNSQMSSIVNANINFFSVNLKGMNRGT